MKVFFATLNPCAARMVNIQQYTDFARKCGHNIIDNPNEADMIFAWGCEFREDWKSFTDDIILDLNVTYKAKIVYLGCTLKKSSENDQGVITIPWKDTTKMFEKLLTTDPDKHLKNTKMVFVVPPVSNNIEEYKKNNPNAKVWFEDEYIKVNICEGCLEYCTYCSEKLMFPKFRSFPEDELIKQTKNIIERYEKTKILLLGDSTGDYGRDTNTSICELISRFQNEIAKDIKIGITQLNPQHFLAHKEEMFSLIESGTLEYLNLPVQSVSNKILKMMNRQYTNADLTELFDGLKKLKFNNFSTHFLIGFPGETKDDVKQSVEFFTKYKPRHIIASIFMPHPKIKASTFPDKVSDVEIQDRIQFCKDELCAVGVKVFSDNKSKNNRIMQNILTSLFPEQQR